MLSSDPFNSNPVYFWDCFSDTIVLEDITLDISSKRSYQSSGNDIFGIGRIFIYIKILMSINNSEHKTNVELMIFSNQKLNKGWSLERNYIRPRCRESMQAKLVWTLILLIDDFFYESILSDDR